MKTNTLFLIGLIVFLSACANTGQVGTKPNITPVTTSNKATRASLKKTRSAIHRAQLKAAEGDTALEKAHSYLSQLLNEK